MVGTGSFSIQILIYSQVKLIKKYFYNLLNTLFVIHVVYFTPLGELICLLIQRDKYLCKDVLVLTLTHYFFTSTGYILLVRMPNVFFLHYPYLL
jgi:hypothetical protein